MIAIYDLDCISVTFLGRLNIEFNDPLTLSTETSAGEHNLQRVIDDCGVGINFVQSGSAEDDDTVARFIDEHGTDLYALVLRIADLEAAKAEWPTSTSNRLATSQPVSLPSISVIRDFVAYSSS